MIIEALLGALLTTTPSTTNLPDKQVSPTAPPYAGYLDCKVGSKNGSLDMYCKRVKDTDWSKCEVATERDQKGDQYLTLHCVKQ